MTNKEAIEHLIDPIGKGVAEHVEAIRIALDAIEKQIPMKPFKWCKLIYICPTCHRSEYIRQRDALDTYCGFCGQAIDWSEVEE